MIELNTMASLEIVYDWNDRIKDYSNEVKQLYNKLFEIEKEYDDLLSGENLPWKLCLDSKKKGSELKYWQMTSNRGMQILKV